MTSTLEAAPSRRDYVLAMDLLDATTNALVDDDRVVAGADHDDWDEYRAAMATEGRLIAGVTPASTVGQIN